MSAQAPMVPVRGGPSRHRLVGVPGLEPGAFRSQSGRATKLRHTPQNPRSRTRDARAFVPVKTTPSSWGRPKPGASRHPGQAGRCRRRDQLECSRTGHRRGMRPPGPAGVAQWQSPSLPSWPCGFDSRHPLHAKPQVTPPRRNPRLLRARPNRRVSCPRRARHLSSLVVQASHGQVDDCSSHPARLIGSHKDRHVSQLRERRKPSRVGPACA